MTGDTIEIFPTPSQQWLLRRGLARPHFWNITAELEVDTALDFGILKRAFQHVIAHHDALRLSFHRSGDDWIAKVHARVDSVPATHMDLSDATDGQLETAMRSVTEKIELSLDIGSPPLLHLAVFDAGPRRPQRVVLTMHHLICDMFSMRLVLRDVETAYRSLSTGGAVNLPPRTTSYAEWARKLHTADIPSALRPALERWLQQPFGDVAKPSCDFGDPSAVPTVGSMRYSPIQLGAKESAALWKMKGEGGDARSAILAGAAKAASRLTGGNHVSFNVVVHGRTPVFPDVDLSRTVGYFALSIPVVLDVEPEVGPGTAERVRKHLADVALDCGVLFRRERAVAEAVQRHWPVLRLNPIGRVTVAGEEASAFRLIRVLLREDASNPQFFHLNCSYLRGIAINQALREMRSDADDELTLIWEYGEASYNPGTIERLASDSLDAVRRMLPARAE